MFILIFSRLSAQWSSLLCCSKCFEVSFADCLAASCLGKITAWKTKIGDTALLLTGVFCHLNDIPLFSLFSTTCHFEGTTRKNVLFSFTKKPWNMHRVSHNKPHLHPTIYYYLLILWEHTTVFIIDCRRSNSNQYSMVWVSFHHTLMAGWMRLAWLPWLSWCVPSYASWITELSQLSRFLSALLESGFSQLYLDAKLPQNFVSFSS